MPSIEEILAVAEDPAYHRIVTARISAVPQEARDEHARLDALLPTLTSDTIDAHPDLRATAARIAELEAKMLASVIEFRFKSIGHRAWRDLLAAHPPTKAQRSAERLVDHNPDTFPYEAMAASCIDPVMTVDDVRRLERTPLIDVQFWDTLWSACLRANVVDAAPKSLAAGLILRQSGGSVTTAANGASLARSSSAA